MKKFSERTGITKTPAIQIDCMSEPLKNTLWNIILGYLDLLTPTPISIALDHPDPRHNFIKNLARSFFKVPVDNISSSSTNLAREWLKSEFYKLEWYRIYDLIEHLVQNVDDFKHRVEQINQILEEEGSGYRFINNQCVPMTNKQEIQAIEEAIGKAEQFGKGANKHLSQAVTLFSKRPDPDYCNSIKESVSAMESLVKQLSGKDGTFGPALKELSKKLGLHTALGGSISNLYGYASDESGIRHGSPKESNVDFDEAKFMLVTCSAFVNFLLSKAQKAGLLKEG